MNTPVGLPDEATHRLARRALPWLLNGTLEQPERDSVLSHLADCAECRQELAALDVLRRTADQTAPAADPERALSRMRLMLAGAGPTLPAAGGAAAPVAGAANDSRWLRAACAVQFCLIVLLSGLLLRPAGPESAYRLLGAGQPPDAAMAVQFAPGTPEHELRRILQASGARIVDGPTATGAYLLDLPGQALPAALARMRAEPAVRLAQPLTDAIPP